MIRLEGDTARTLAEGLLSFLVLMTFLFVFIWCAIVWTKEDSLAGVDQWGTIRSEAHD